MKESESESRYKRKKMLIEKNISQLEFFLPTENP